MQELGMEQREGTAPWRRRGGEEDRDPKQAWNPEAYFLVPAPQQLHDLPDFIHLPQPARVAEAAVRAALATHAKHATRLTVFHVPGSPAADHAPAHNQAWESWHLVSQHGAGDPGEPG